MNALLVCAVVVPMFDHTVKRVVRRRVGERTLPLGVLGELRVVESQIWGRRALGGVSLPALWAVWVAAAGAAIGAAVMLPATGWAFGLLLGGSLSHALETSVRGSVCDYVCLRFWPAFDLADVALTIGVIALAFDLVRALS